MPPGDHSDLARLVRHWPEAMILTDARDLVVAINPSAECLLGFSGAEILGRAFAELLADELPTTAGSVFRTDLRRKAGDTVAVQVTRAPVGDASSGAHLAALRRVNTEVGGADSDDAADSSPYRVYFRSAPAMMHNVKPDGRIDDVSDRWLEVMGYRRDEVIGRTLTAFLTPESRKRAETEVVPRYLEIGRCDAVPYRFVRRDGTEFDAELSAVFVGDDVKTPRRGLSVFVDVTARTLAQAERDETEARLYDLLETASDWYWETDEKHRLTWLTEPSSGFHRPGRQFPGLTRWEIAAADPGDPNWAAHIATLNAHETFRDFCYDYVTKAGERVYRRVSGKPMFDGTGRFIGYRGTAHDITESRRAEQELIRLNQALTQKTEQLSQFTHFASHDLQEPLRKVRSYIEMLEEDLANHLSMEQQLMMDVIADGAKRMSSLIDDLLALSHADHGTLTRGTVDMKSVLASVDELFAVSLADIGGRMTIDPMPVLSGDAGLLRSLFENLVSNSIKYRDEARPLRIRIDIDTSVASPATGGPSMVGIRYSDNGIGFDPSQAETILQPFQRLRSALKVPGSGVGLAICAAIAKRHGGDLKAEGYPGEGAIFTLTLPGA